MEHLLSDTDDFELWVLLRQTGDLLLRDRNRELNQYGLTIWHAAALNIIKLLGTRATPAEISRCLIRRPHTVSELLSKMERRGLLKKDKDLRYKNRIRVVLTEKGQEAYSQLIKRESLHSIMSSLTKEQHQQLRQCLEILRTELFERLGIKYRPLLPKSE